MLDQREHQGVEILVRQGKDRGGRQEGEGALEGFDARDDLDGFAHEGLPLPRLLPLAATLRRLSGENFFVAERAASPDENL